MTRHPARDNEKRGRIEGVYKFNACIVFVPFCSDLNHCLINYCLIAKRKILMCRFFTKFSNISKAYAVNYRGYIDVKIIYDATDYSS